MNDSMIMFGGLPIDVVGAVSNDVMSSSMVVLSTQWKYDNVELLNCEQNLNCTYVFVDC